MICQVCKVPFEDGEPVFKIHTYHSFNDTVNGYPEGYVHIDIYTCSLRKAES